MTRRLKLVRAKLIAFFWLPVFLPVGMLVTYRWVHANNADRYGDVIARRDHARRGLSFLRHPSMRAAIAARLRSWRPLCEVGARRNIVFPYYEVIETLENLAR